MKWLHPKKANSSSGTHSNLQSSIDKISHIRVGCPAHNCGGRCLLIAQVENGRITRLDTDDRPDSLAAPQLRACARGRAYLRRQYHPDRLQYPLKRVGKRGEGQFVRCTWEEANEIVTGQLQRVKSKYGNEALFVPYGTGSYNQLNGSHTARRLMNLIGGCLGSLAASLLLAPMAGLGVTAYLMVPLVVLLTLLL